MKMRFQKKITKKTTSALEKMKINGIFTYN